MQEVKNQGRKNSQLSDAIDKALAKDKAWFTQTSSELSGSGIYPTPPPTGVPNTARMSSHASTILAAGRQSSSARGTLGVQKYDAESGLDLNAVEAGLGLSKSRELSSSEIDDQVQVWQQAQRDAEVHALTAKMLVLGRFSAANLASTQTRASDDNAGSGAQKA